MKGNKLTPSARKRLRESAVSNLNKAFDALNALHQQDPTSGVGAALSATETAQREAISFDHYQLARERNGHG